MSTRDVRSLLVKANPHLTDCLQMAVGFTVARRQTQVSPEHLLLKLLEKGEGDLLRILRHFEVDPNLFEADMLATVERFHSGHDGRPSFSKTLLELLEKGFLAGALELDEDRLRSGGILLAALQGDSSLLDYLDLLSPIRPDELRRNFQEIVHGSAESKPATGRFGPSGERTAAATADGPAPDSALAQFTLDFTAAARDGEIDPVLGRDEEIRQMIDILTRRRKNNPILVGEAGVGKTALVEGLALRIAADDVPSPLQGVEIRSLDLGLLQAGAGVKGEFENRLKSVIAEIRESPIPIVTFIDEAHTLIGAGAASGQGDAANLLKPALARGELRTVAATTWSEYKKYFEKDAALARRFQLVKVDEPDEARATVMMRGLAPKLEDAHGVRVLDSAVVAAVQLSERFLAGRQLPDKSVDLLDTAAARVKIGLSSKPAAVEDLERKIENAERALKAKGRDVADGVGGEDDEIPLLEAEITETGERLETLVARWKEEQVAVEAVLKARGSFDVAEPEASDAAEESDKSQDSSEPEHAEAEAESKTDLSDEPTSQDAEPVPSGEAAGEHDSAGSDTDETPEADRNAEIAQALEALHTLQGADPLVPLEVTPDVIAGVVADWTGIPAGKMQRDQAQSVLELDTQLQKRVIGQDEGLRAMAQRLRAAHAGLGAPEAPQGVFFLVGPSGVGKTETALALADLLYGGERFMAAINMSEYMEAHTVSRLIGSPPGYVGYGEGGVLTEAVRQRPYSVVLLDEVEKAHPDVMNLFYQVFDKGTLSDGEGREIDFRNTVLIMTSNLASDSISAMCEEVEPELHELVEAIRPVLRDRFKPALLARMTVIPYLPLAADTLREIVELKLSSLASRLLDQTRIELSYGSEVTAWIADRCNLESGTVGDSGARHIDHIIQSELLPDLSTEILERLARDEPARAIELGLDDDGRPTHLIH